MVQNCCSRESGGDASLLQFRFAGAEGQPQRFHFAIQPVEHLADGIHPGIASGVTVECELHRQVFGHLQQKWSIRSFLPGLDELIHGLLKGLLTGCRQT